MNNNLDIVICSNSKHLSNLIVNLLKQKGYNSLFIVKSEVELLEFCKKHTPNIVIIDIDSNKFGLNSSNNIIQNLINIDNNLLILAISDDISEEFKNIILSFGAREYLCKPFQPANLWERIIRINNAFISMQKENNSFISESNKEFDSDYLNLPKFIQKPTNSFSQNIDYITNDNSSRENLHTQVNFTSNIQEKKQKKYILKEIFLKFLKK